VGDLFCQPTSEHHRPNQEFIFPRSWVHTCRVDKCPPFVNKTQEPTPFGARNAIQHPHELLHIGFDYIGRNLVAPKDASTRVSPSKFWQQIIIIEK
jgi:hypothetical protein